MHARTYARTHTSTTTVPTLHPQTHHQGRLRIPGESPPLGTSHHVGDKLDGRHQVGEVLHHASHGKSQLLILLQLRRVLQSGRAVREPHLHGLHQEDVPIVLISARQEDEAVEVVLEGGEELGAGGERCEKVGSEREESRQEGGANGRRHLAARTRVGGGGGE